MNTQKNKTKKQYYYLVLFILVVMFPNILLVFVGEDSVVASLLKKVVYSMLCLATVLIPLTFLKPKYYSWLVIVLLPLTLFEISIINHYKAPSSEEAVASLFLTNYYEVIELIKGNFGSVFIAFLLFVFLLFISFRIKKSFTLSAVLKKKLFVFILCFFSVLYVRNFIAATKIKDNLSEIFSLANYSLHVQLYKVFPLDVFFKLNGAYDGIQQKKNYKKEIEGFKFNTVKRDTVDQQEIYVLVVGETARKHNLGLYGYQRNTTPNLEKNKNLFAMKNVSSAANLTSLSIPFILTRAVPENPAPKFSEPAVLNGFKEAGFKTYWISNQSIGVGSVFGFYSSLADVYKNTSISLDAANYDETLFPVLDDILKDTTSNKKFIVIHTLGNHFRYNYRYPEAYKKYKPTMSRGVSMENTTDISKKQELINSYDNSILYTDYVLSNFIKQIEKQQAISYLYYISDHGENLFDDERNRLLHAYNEPTEYEIEIPLIIWTSNLYNEIYSEKTQNLHQNVNSRISSTNTFHTLLDLSNIKYPSEELNKSFASPKFDSLQKRSFYKIDKTVLKLD